VMRNDNSTMELPGVVKRRGRPAAQAQDKKTLRDAAARRKRESRARLAAAGLDTLTLDLDQEVSCALRAYVERKRADAEDLTLGQAVERILRDRLLRKR
jgi:hypothetical protein